MPAARPAILRGIAANWPVVRAARTSDEALATYLRRFGRGRPLGAMIGPPRIKGRFSYNEALAGFNFRRQTVRLSGALDLLLAAAEDAEPVALAIQSVKVWQNLSGFDAENVLPLLDRRVEPRVWIGNRVTVATHQDPSENIAVCVAGRRRFTLFPSDQLANLHMDPFERTTISLVEPDSPISKASPASLKRSRTHSPSIWSRATRSMCPICGGTTSARWTNSTCWLITGGARPHSPTTIRSTPCSMRSSRSVTCRRRTTRRGVRISTTMCSAVRTRPPRTCRKTGAACSGRWMPKAEALRQAILAGLKRDAPRN